MDRQRRHSGRASSMRRPSRVTLAAIALGLVALICFGAGLLLYAGTNCCGSPNQPDRGPLVTGTLLALLLGAAAIELWRAHPRRLLVAALTLMLPLECLLAWGAGQVSEDLDEIFVPVFAMWIGLCLLLRSSPVARWSQPTSDVG